MDGVDLRIALLKTTGAGRLPLLGMLDFLEHFGGCSFLKCRYIENNSASCASTPATSLDNSLHCCRGCSISPSMSKCMLAPSRSTRSSKELCESTRHGMECCGVILFARALYSSDPLRGSSRLAGAAAEATLETSGLGLAK